MIDKLNLKIKAILYFLLMLYPILPTNHYISVLSYSNICSILIVIFFLINNRNIEALNFFKYNFFFWFYLVIYAAFAFATASTATGISWIFSTMLVPFIVIQMVSSEEDFYQIIELIIIASIFLSFIGIFESLSRNYLFQGALFADWSDKFRYGFLRCAGPFGHPINFGQYQAIAAVLSFYRINSGLEPKKVRLYKCAYILAVISLICSVSRLPICFFAAAQFVLILWMGTRRSIQYFCIGGLVVVAGIIILDITGLDVFSLISDLIVSVMEMLGLGSTKAHSNAIGLGNRFDLYKWVIGAVGENFLFGNGINAQFAYQIASWFTKTSIEVHYLYIYFKCGLVGLASLVLSYVGNILYFGKRRKYRLFNEKKITFGKVLVLMLILYYICLFGVQETDLTRLYCELIALGIGYCRISKKSILNEKYNC